MTMLVRLTKAGGKDEGARFWVGGGGAVRQMAGDKLRGTKDGLAGSGTPFS